MRPSNPAFSDKTVAGYSKLKDSSALTPDRCMTVRGTVNKSFLLLFLVMISAAIGWKAVLLTGIPQPVTEMCKLTIAALIVGMITCFKESWSPVLAPIYALLEGGVLGMFAALIEIRYPGTAINALICTLGTFLTFFTIYKSGFIKVTSGLSFGIIVATFSVALIYFAAIVLSLFRISMPYLHDSGPVGIGISFVIVAVAAFNLLLDFDVIEQGAKAQIPKYMEWFAAFGLMLTIIWLYIEFIRLLSKLSNNRLTYIHGLLY